MADAGFLTVFIAGVVQCSVVLTRIGFFDDTAIQTVRNQAGRSAYARSASWSIRSARTALDGLSEGQLSTFRFGSSPACDR